MAEQQCDVHAEKIKQLERSTTIVLPKTDDDQWNAINEIRAFMRKLVPIWVTVVLMVSSFVTGSALTFAGMIIKFAGQQK